MDEPVAVKPVELLGIPIHPVSPEQLVESIVDFGRGDRLRRVYNVNVHAMNLADDDPEFAGWLRRTCGEPSLTLHRRRGAGLA